EAKHQRHARLAGTRQDRTLRQRPSATRRPPAAVARRASRRHGRRLTLQARRHPARGLPRRPVRGPWRPRRRHHRWMADRASITAKKAKTRTASVLLPERTVDSLFAYETLTAAPHALIWSPPNSTPDEHGLKPDHVVTPDLNPGLPLEQHRRLVFECKTIYGEGADPGGWHFRISRWQLDEYVQVAPQTLYLLPSHESSVQPWWRYRCCAGANATCYSCRRPGDRRWEAGKFRGGWGHLPWYIGFQPWFSHWAWCVESAWVSFLSVSLSGGRREA